MLPLVLWGCESLPFRWGGDVEVKDLVVKGGGVGKPQKILPAPAMVPPTDSNKLADGRVVKNKSMEKKLVEKKITYKVVKGDTIYSLARQNNMTVADMAKDNNLKITDQLKIGQNIVIRKKIVENAQGNSNGMTPPTSQSAVTTTPLTAPSANNDNGSVAQPQGFIWPLQRPSLLQKFGDGASQDGVILGGAMGQNVVAAGNGAVIYVGTDIKPLGLLVLVKHDNGLVSTYGYLQKSFVKKGDMVKRGQLIAALGRSGMAQRPQLYFEIRKKNRPANPLDFLPARANN